MSGIASPSSRRSSLKAIRHLLQHAVPTMIKVNPAAAIAQVKLPKSTGHHSWSDCEIAGFRKHWKLGTKARLVMELALKTVSRRGEVTALGPRHQSYDAEGNRKLRIERTHGSEDVEIPMSDMLAAAIDAMPKPQAYKGVLPLTFVYTEYGKPHSKKGLRQRFCAVGKGSGTSRPLPPARSKKGRHASACRGWKHDPRTDGDVWTQNACRSRTVHEGSRQEAARQIRRGQDARGPGASACTPHRSEREANGSGIRLHKHNRSGCTNTRISH